MAEAENPTPKQSIKFESATPLAANTRPPGQNTRQKPRRPPKPNYARIHAKPLPLEVFPLPAFVPHNPLSLLRIISALINEWIQRPPSLPETTYQGYLSHETRSIHITDPKHARALWEMGFFGKGSLSRSEPTWLDRERARRKAGLGGTSEEATSKRREERRMFKLERARLEREAIEEQLRKEGKLAELRPETELAASKAGKSEQGRPMKPSRIPRGTMESSSESVHASGRHTTPPKYDDAAAHPEDVGDPEDDAPPVDQEHLQLNLCEAFFLAYGLGVLSISADDGSTEENCKQDTLQPSDLLESFARHSESRMGGAARLKVCV
ncbi:hypothetical protein B9Z65_1928 [Elsinoe australis]|uniref:tRNA-splicing endonuclease subunit Sen2 n=1 Tax=Elsinoe australis TaxID=40998 RepID=A0A2P7YLD8_9PEZI|nr:hypothetical protein B9Z65_1928 [Elsinoe australis]